MKNQNIICVSNTTWEGDYMKAVVHTMGNLAANNNVLFIDYAFTIKDLFSGLFGKNKNIPVSRMLSTSPRLRSIDYKKNKLHHLTLPPILPVSWISNPFLFDLIMLIQSFILSVFYIKPALNKLKYRKSVMINAFNPVMGVPLMKALRIEKTIYYCYDEISAVIWNKKHGERLEPKMIEKSDLVVVTSTALYDSKRVQNKNTVLIKNGVDFDLFHSAFTTEKNTGSKTIGYVGSLDFRVDYELLETVINSKPDYEFVFVGRIIDKSSCSKLDLYPNVEFLGSLQPLELPAIIKNFDLAIIPFVKNEFTRNIYPLKINEYLAAGLPVVTTDFADLSDFERLITVTTNKDHFTENIDKALESTSKYLPERVQMAKENDWLNRAGQFAQAFEQFNIVGYEVA